MGSVMDQERPWERDTKPEGATLRERIKDVLRDKNRLHETVEQIICELERLEAMITPAPQTNVRVKPLEWNPYRAETPFGYYYIDDQRDRPAAELEGRKPFLLSGSRLDLARYETLEAARAAAQAHYKHCILSAIDYPSPQPREGASHPPQQEPGRLREALETTLQALNDWSVTFAWDMCGLEALQEAQDRLAAAGGTLAYISDAAEKARAALAEDGL